jgi:hypothetical protein
MRWNSSIIIIVLCIHSLVCQADERVTTEVSQGSISKAFSCSESAKNTVFLITELSDKKNSVALVRKRIMPTERPLLVDFCG